MSELPFDPDPEDLDSDHPLVTPEEQEDGRRLGDSIDSDNDDDNGEDDS